MIQESTIEKIVQQFENEQIDYELTVREFGGRQPALLSYLMSDNEGVFTEDEQDYLLWLAMVIFKAIESEFGEQEKIQPEAVMAADEINWDKLEEVKSKDFRERLNVFFEDSPQEDLLAFVEDSLVPDEEEEDDFQITTEGREPMFVALKTMIDLMTEEM